eukprot:scaffold18458_cov17-Tisochrysis_lutea.AAC.1
MTHHRARTHSSRTPYYVLARGAPSGGSKQDSHPGTQDSHIMRPAFHTRLCCRSSFCAGILPAFSASDIFNSGLLPLHPPISNHRSKEQKRAELRS